MFSKAIYYQHTTPEIFLLFKSIIFFIIEYKMKTLVFLKNDDFISLLKSDK